MLSWLSSQLHQHVYLRLAWSLLNTKVFITMNLFQDVIMDLIFTNDGFHFIGYGNDLILGCVKFNEPYTLPFFRLV